MEKNLDKNFWTTFFFANLAQTYVKPNLVLSHLGLGVQGPKIKVAQNGLKHILVLELLKSDAIFKIS